MLAASIVFVTILFLVDKNGQWKNFWRVVGLMILLAALGIAGIYANERVEARKQATPLFDMSKARSIGPDAVFTIEPPDEKYSDLPEGAKVLIPRPDFSKNPPRVPSPQNPIR